MRARVLGLGAALAAGCAQPAPIDGKGQPCVSGYDWCPSQNMCLRHGQDVCVDAGPWPVSTAPTAPLPIDGATVFAFSQVNIKDANPVDDQLLLQLAPDMVIRAWTQWDKYGISPSEYQAVYVADCHKAGIGYFMGGATATVLFPDQFGPTDATNPQFLDNATRDAHDVPLPRKDGWYRATLANPQFRQYLIGIGKAQIDVGVDGLNFSEINGAYQGANQADDYLADNNEGFDDYHLADFNAYLLAKFGAGADFRGRFGMTADNFLDPNLPPGDLHGNFDYRRYLNNKGWADDPFNPANLLADQWGKVTVNRPRPGASTFADSAEPYRYWRQIVDELRSYAKEHAGRDILISAEGIYPYVDFQSVGLDLFNTDGDDGSAVHYVPVDPDSGRLRGATSLQAAFGKLKSISAQFAPGAPLVLFLDGRQPLYQAMSDLDRRAFWRLYQAEAYANGLFLAFHLRSSVGDPPEDDAGNLGLMDLFTGLAAFYRGHADLYHGSVPVAVTVTTSLDRPMIAVSDQPDRHRRLVHIVNHEWSPDTGIVPRPLVPVTISSAARPANVAVVSPDPGAGVDPLPFDYAGGQITATLPLVDAYDVVVISYPQE
jgi:hypothetical protein